MDKIHFFLFSMLNLGPVEMMIFLLGKFSYFFSRQSFLSYHKNSKKKKLNKYILKKKWGHEGLEIQCLCFNWLCSGTSMCAGYRWVGILKKAVHLLTLRISNRTCRAIYNEKMCVGQELGQQNMSGYPFRTPSRTLG